MQCEECSVIEELHRIGFPVTGIGSVGELSWTLGDRHSASDEHNGASALAAAVATLGLGARQIASPGVVLGPGDLGVDEAVDRLVADDRLALLQRQAPGNRLGRQPSLQELKNQLLKLGLPQQPATSPTARMGLLAGIAGLVGCWAAIAF